MTYRKLFLWLLLGSTLAVASLWTWSCWGYSEVDARQSLNSGYYQAGIWSGTVILELYSPEVRPTKDEADAVPVFQHFFLPGFSPDSWSVGWRSSSDLTSRFYKYRRMGEFGLEKKFYPIVMGHSTLHYCASYRLDFPLWVPWVLFVAAALAVTRWLERRSAGTGEKRLAGVVD